MSNNPDIDTDLRSQLQDAMRNLPRRQREIFIAHRLEAMSYDEIARRTGLDVRRVERHMTRAIYKLVKQLDGRKLSLWERWF